VWIFRGIVTLYGVADPETSGVTDPETLDVTDPETSGWPIPKRRQHIVNCQRNIPEEWRPRSHRDESLKSLVNFLFSFSHSNYCICRLVRRISFSGKSLPKSFYFWNRNRKAVKFAANTSLITGSVLSAVASFEAGNTTLKSWEVWQIKLHSHVIYWITFHINNNWRQHTTSRTAFFQSVIRIKESLRIWTQCF
jgi:hypothetical protein